MYVSNQSYFGSLLNSPAVTKRSGPQATSPAAVVFSAVRPLWPKSLVAQACLPPSESLSQLDLLGGYSPSLARANMPDLTLMRHFCDRYSGRKALGCDGWSPKVLGCLPEPLLWLFRCFFGKAMTQRQWPSSFVNYIALLPKPGQSSDNLRPIGKTPMLFRMWSVGFMVCAVP